MPHEVALSSSHTLPFVRSRALLLGAGATLLLPGCGTSSTREEPALPPPIPAPEPTRCVDELYEGTPLQAGTRVVACGLAPRTELIDVVDGALYTTSPRGAFFASDAGTSERTRLYQGFANDSTPTYLDGQIYFDGWSGSGDRLRSGMLAIDVHGHTPDLEPRVVSEAYGYAVGGRVLADGLVRYVGESGLQAVLELDVPSGRTRRVVNGTAVGLTPTWLYYCAVDSEVRRIRRDGTDDQRLADASVPAPHCTAELRAVDDDGIYLTRRDAPYEIWRFGPDGREDFIGTTWEGNEEIVIPPPARLFVHEGWVYVLRQPSGGHGSDTLSRLAVDREEELLVGGTDLGPPLFRDGRLYVALTRDGLDGPLDGVVLELDLGTP
jgi:hypothetical protein